METEIKFEEGKPCPVGIQGSGGGLSFSSYGDMLLVGAIPNPSPEQIKAWEGKWRAKLLQESEFPSIPIFAIGGEDWILEAPCNPVQQELESPGFCEALFAKEENVMVAILVDSETKIIHKITTVPLDELFIERLVLSWNPYRHPSNDYTKSFNNEEFSERVGSIFRTRTSKDVWTSSW